MRLLLAAYMSQMTGQSNSGSTGQLSYTISKFASTANGLTIMAYAYMERLTAVLSYRNIISHRVERV